MFSLSVISLALAAFGRSYRKRKGKHVLLSIWNVLFSLYQKIHVCVRCFDVLSMISKYRVNVVKEKADFW